MANFLGGFRQLKNVLQIPLTGWFHPGRGAQDVGAFVLMFGLVMVVTSSASMPMMAMSATLTILLTVSGVRLLDA